MGVGWVRALAPPSMLLMFPERGVLGVQVFLLQRMPDKFLRCLPGLCARPCPACCLLACPAEQWRSW